MNWSLTLYVVWLNTPKLNLTTKIHVFNCTVLQADSTSSSSAHSTYKSVYVNQTDYFYSRLNWNGLSLRLQVAQLTPMVLTAIQEWNPWRMTDHRIRETKNKKTEQLWFLTIFNWNIFVGMYDWIQEKKGRVSRPWRQSQLTINPTCKSKQSADEIPTLLH